MSSILLIDDEQDILDILQYNLEKEGYKVYSSTNEIDGISLAKKHKPDIIVLDVMLPGTDGIEVCEALRKMPELSETKICFLSARGEDYSQIAGLDAGADDYISKPIKPKVFMSRMKALLRRNEAMGEYVNLNNFIIDRDRYLVIKNNITFNLPKKEF